MHWLHQRPLGSMLIPLLQAFALLLAAPAFAAPPAVPAALPYQGLLLDGLGQPRTGSVDLTVRVFDALIGGALVYKQSFPAVSLADGVFSVQLGPSGEANDAPSNPLTTDLATALGGDAGATSPVRFLEVTVGTDGALSRTQILSSAYALRATSAATADSATTATTAVTAQNASNLGGRAAGFFDQYFKNTNLDNDFPGNDDPREGLLDADGDGVANFLESDNDSDGFLDSVEIAQGSDINLTTPRALSVTPPSAFYSDVTNVTVQGAGFEPGLSVVIGSQTPAPSSITATSFNVTVGPQSPGAVDVTVTNPNGQSSVASALFQFTSSLAHAVPLGSYQTTLAALPGTGVLALGGRKQYGVGTSAQLLLTLGSKAANGQLGMGWSASGALAAVRCRDLGSSCAVEILVDGDADRNLEEETGIPIETIATGSPMLLAADVRLDASNRWLAGYVRRNITSEAVVAHDRDGDGLFTGPNEVSLVESALSTTTVIPAESAVDASGRAALAYVTGTGSVRFGWDRNNDGDFVDVIGGNPEVATLSTLGSACIGATFDGAGHPAVIYSSGASVYLARDGNDDGDFADASETQVVAGIASSACDVAYKPGQPLALAYNEGTIHLRLDKNNDGDFADTGEDTALDRAGGAEMELALNGVDRAFIAVSGFILVGITN
jgi:hypothetical protein